MASRFREERKLPKPVDLAITGKNHCLGIKIKETTAGGNYITFTGLS
jgi:hypothetical protein